MAYKEVIRRQYEDLNNLSSMLRNYIEIYRLLISSTSELNNTSIIKKGELKKAIERIDDVGDIIDEILKIINDFIKIVIGHVAVHNVWRQFLRLCL